MRAETRKLLEWPTAGEVWHHLSTAPPELLEDFVTHGERPEFRAHHQHLSPARELVKNRQAGRQDKLGVAGLERADRANRIALAALLLSLLAIFISLLKK